MDTHKKEPVHHAVNSSSKAESDKDYDISKSSDPEKPSDGSMMAVEPSATEYEYITGIRLWLVVASVTLVCFLILLDMSIIVTVSPDASISVSNLLINMTGYPSNHQ
jgi:hypothetical protein